MTRYAILSFFLALTVAACGEKTPPTNSPAEQNAVETAPPAAAGDTIEIKAISDEIGNRFEPTDVEAHRGDILRVTLVSGVHNIHFPPETNPGATGLPPASDMLQLPGQTVDIPLTFAPGHYNFQCDPHAALGMLGKLEIED